MVGTAITTASARPAVAARHLELAAGGEQRELAGAELLVEGEHHGQLLVVGSSCTRSTLRF